MSIIIPGGDNPPPTGGKKIIIDAHDADTSELNLHTAKCNHIPNFQSRKPIDAYNLRIMREIEADYPGALRPRGGPTAIYNCHGLVFGSRRTEINEPAALKLIIDDDEYKEVAKADAMEGDVLLYFRDGGIEHSAIVVERPSGLLGIPIVVSKWGCGGEYVHPANQCPYNYGDSRYFRIRP